MKKPKVQQKTERRISAALRLVLVAVLLLAQIALVLVLNDLLRQRMAIAYTLLELVALAYVFRINSRPGGGSYKLGWTLLILTVPVVGLILYWLWNGDHPQKRLDLQKLPRPRESDARQEHSRLQVEHLRREHPEWGRLAAYLDRQGFPLYTGTGADVSAHRRGVSGGPAGAHGAGGALHLSWSFTSWPRGSCGTG